MAPTYPLGTLVWAMIEGYPWWPAHVVRPRDLCLGVRDVAPEPRPGDVLVEFFNDGQRFAVLPLPRVRPFLPPHPAPGPPAPAHLAPALRTAVQHAKRFARDTPAALEQARKAAQIFATEHIPDTALRDSRKHHLHPRPRGHGHDDDDDDHADDDDDDDEHDDHDHDHDDDEDDDDADADPSVLDVSDPDERSTRRETHPAPPHTSRTRTRLPDPAPRRLPPRRKAAPRPSSTPLTPTTTPAPTPAANPTTSPTPRRLTRRAVATLTPSPPSPARQPHNQTARTRPKTPKRATATTPVTPRKRRRTLEHGDNSKAWQASPTHLDDVVDEASSSAAANNPAAVTKDARAPAEADAARPREPEGDPADKPDAVREEAVVQPEQQNGAGSEGGQHEERVVDLVTEDTHTNAPNAAAAAAPGSEDGETSVKERSVGSGVPCEEEMVTEEGDDMDDGEDEEQTMVHREVDTVNEGDVYQILNKDQVISLLVAREREIRAYYHQNKILQRKIKQLESGELLRKGQELLERCRPLFEDVNHFLTESVSKGRVESRRR